MTNAPNNNYLNNPDLTSELSAGPKGYNRNYAAKTIDPEEDKASNYENVSAGGTRYIVGLKGNLKFYGGQSNSQADINESLSAYSRSRGGGPLADLADSISRGKVDDDNHSMEDGSIDRSEYDPRRRTGTAYQDDFEKNSMNSMPRNAELNNGGFPINGPGEERSRHHGKKKKKKRKDHRPTTQQYSGPGGLPQNDYVHQDVIGDYSEHSQSAYSASKSARGRRQEAPAPNLGERNKSVGSTGGERRMPMGQIAQHGSGIRLDDPGDYTRD